MSAGTDEPKTIIAAVLRWAGTQPFNNLITAVLLLEVAAVGYGVYQVVVTEIPKQIASIQSGYEKQERSHTEQLDRVLATWKEERTLDRQHAREMVEAIRGQPLAVAPGTR